MVTNLPSVPARGLLFTLKIIEIVGSSISTKAIGSGLFISQRESPIFISGIPERAIISPIEAVFVSTLLSPLKVYNLTTLDLIIAPSFLQSAISSFSETDPREIRPIPILPR